MSGVTGFGIQKGFLTKSVKEILWDHECVSDVTGCGKTQVLDGTSSTHARSITFSCVWLSSNLFLQCQFLLTFCKQKMPPFDQKTPRSFDKCEMWVNYMLYYLSLTLQDLRIRSINFITFKILSRHGCIYFSNGKQFCWKTLVKLVLPRSLSKIEKKHFHIN